MPFAPYVGITGFMDKEEVLEMLPLVDANPSRKFMVGVLANDKTVHGQSPSRPRRYPKFQDIAGIFSQHPRVVNLIHYHTSNRQYLELELIRLRHLQGSIHGFQLNVVWPSVTSLYCVADAWMNQLQFVIQIGAQAMKEMNHSPREIARRVSEYGREIIGGVLIDPSGGTDKPFDPLFARDCFRALQDECPGAPCGVAGGLGPDSLHLLDTLLAEFPEMNIDVEKNVRDVNNNLDLIAAQIYLTRALAKCKQARTASALTQTE